MSPNIHFEARLLVLGMATGVGLMVLYDLLRLFRVLVHHGWLWVGRENDGALRLYVISTVLLSMIAYDRLLGAFFRKVLKKMGRCFRIGVSKGNQR